MSQLPESVFKRLYAVFLDEAALERVVLFGSRARGDHRDNSDIDLALYGKDIPLSIHTQLRDAAGLYKLDIVNMENLDNAELHHEIEADGQTLYTAYYAHRAESADKNQWQLLNSHLLEVGKRAAEFAAHFKAEKWGELAGRLHDAGKFSEAFQQRLNGSPVRVDHSTAGAQYVHKQWGGDSIAHIAAYVIAGHHAGLVDFGTAGSANERVLARRLVKEGLPSYRAALEQHMPRAAGDPMPLPLVPGFHAGMTLSMFIRMLFSCVIDADSLDAERYANRARAELRGRAASMSLLLERFEGHISDNFAAPEKRIDTVRSELLKACMARAEGEQGLYTLTLPTGSGKTLISLGFSLAHAVHWKLRRIIFVIPYTSIIEQNAKIYRDILGADQVLEHHSNIRHESSDDDWEQMDETRKIKKKLALATENWDLPVVVTTNVQFFESLFGNTRSRCRKLHNLANSVIVLDEAQMMNGQFFKPSLYALEELARNYGSTIVFSTATQPNLSSLFAGSGNQTRSSVASPLPIQELIGDVSPGRFECFQRVRPLMLGRQDDDALVNRLAGHRQAMCVVNTRQSARELYEKTLERIGDPTVVFHLSARMCAKHREHRLRRIRRRLFCKLPCVLISTQLIECGVDIDFPVVYRELAGLDSIVQAAGRCNRNGEGSIDESFVYVFERSTPNPNSWLRTSADIAKEVIGTYGEDSFSSAAIQAYFAKVYQYQSLGRSSEDKTDKHQIMAKLNDKAAYLEFPFETVARLFRLVDKTTKPVVIGYDAYALQQLERLRQTDRVFGILRSLQPYVVQLDPDEFKAFCKAGLVDEIREGVFALKHPDQWYLKDLGVRPFSKTLAEDE
ncbi:CRISPR-associated helicase Cas3' [Paenibacillus sp. IB182496]|uniref:CRISPR-associated helicase Cas3 n=1 Tax=Paenibacillus sabuli TaxID=2772509 RepID=A0A927BTA3_9BACL|nr:CRISPR-associated helicase Cas3' [Paenibacillus sabuli]MBD2846388.1 CRISPR-associated helicase Cas3' [Paenibacillus sabuli]